MYTPLRLIILCSFIYSSTLFVAAQETRLKSITTKLYQFNKLFPQEKVYLHLDNTGYVRGEKIWFAAYVVRSDGVQEDLSKTLYLELLNPVGEVFETQKLHIENGRAHGQISLSGKPVPTGFYEIRAYTRYMTNWDATGIFSRVIPVFAEIESKGNEERHYEMTHLEALNRKEVEGQLATRERSARERTMRNLSICDTLSQPNRTPFLDGKDINTVHFYPEGGALVCGLPSRVAFDLNEAAHYSAPHTGQLVDEAGYVLAEVSTQHEGRGTFVCVPDGHPLYLQFKGKRFPLPQAEADGCVMSVNTLNDKAITIEVQGTATYAGDTLGLTLLHNGQLIYFGEAVLGDEPFYKVFQRDGLPVGVNQFTLFNSEGRILADRLFFIAPRKEDISHIAVTMSDTITPYGKVAMTLRGAPNESFSLAIRDCDQSVAPPNGTDIASWFLLTSDLKGFIRNAEYYIEADNTEHRRAADLLMMVQGWRRYNWRQMAGLDPFETKQPIEDGLYLDGYVLRNELPVPEASLSVVLNKTGRIPTGANVTPQPDGFYAIQLPDKLRGEWDMTLQTEIGGKKQDMNVSIHRHFSPGKKSLSLFETDMTPYSPTRFFSPTFLPLDSVSLPKSTFYENILDEAVVQRKRKKKEYTHTGKDLAAEKDLLSTNYIFYDVTKEADEYADKGLPVPTLSEWVRNKAYVRQAMDAGRELMYWNLSEGLEIASSEQTFSGSDLRAFEMFGEYVPEVTITTSQGSLLPNKRAISQPMEQPLSAFRTAYIRIAPLDTIFSINQTNSPDRRSAKLKQQENEQFKNSIGLMFFQRRMLLDRQKGVRQTYYLGYNEAETFVAPDYSVLPVAPDHRRTLYWNPHITLGTNGESRIYFYNNSSCRNIFVNAEGLTSTGIPTL